VTAAPTGAVGVPETTFASVKVEPFIEEAVIGSEKVAVTLTVRATPVALFPGVIALTVGGPGAARPCSRFSKSMESARTSVITADVNAPIVLLLIYWAPVPYSKAGPYLCGGFGAVGCGVQTWYGLSHQR
jgi:hypothetical protein